MNSSPNRERLIREGRHCRCCSQWVIRVGDDEIRKVYRTGAHRLNSNLGHGKVKQKGQHAYRKGSVQC